LRKALLRRLKQRLQHRAFRTAEGAAVQLEDQMQ
jgi:hypothetical protein